ncbi:site-specific integrase [Novosphingobium sp. ST904]|nr:site-specific integrase [Novosphingobium sp. ST904]TCM41525.1 phage integrase family protein [Novosphingobium sp. ST904]
MPWTVYNRHGQRKYLTNNEIDAFIRSARNRSADVRTFCWMLAYTGCRISEALSLTVDSIDFEAKHVIIQCLKKRGKRIFRAIPLPPNFLRVLYKWLRSRSSDDPELWPWSRMTGYRRICEVMESAGITGTYASPKGLRHGFGVRAIQAGVPLTLVQRWLGHADIKTTAIYTSAVGPEEREIAARMWRQKITEKSKFSDMLPGDDLVEFAGEPVSTAKVAEGVSGGSVNRPSSKDMVNPGKGDLLNLPVNGDPQPWPQKASQSPLKRITYCSVIHFWLKCRDHFRCNSMTCVDPANNLADPANDPSAGSARLCGRSARAFWPLGVESALQSLYDGC